MIDAEIQAFIDASNRFYPEDAASRSIAEQRRLYDAYAAAFALPRPEGLLVHDAVLELPDRRVPLRRYRRPEARRRGTILYAHGGGFMLGSLDSHDGVAARIAARCGAAVVSVAYRLAPEHRAPAARDDIEAAARAIAAGEAPWSDLDRPLIFAGDSAGATLVASSALMLRGTPAAPQAMALIYPMLGREPALPAAESEAEAPMLTLADVRYYRDLYLGGREPDAATFPLEAPSLANLPPTFLFAAEHDPLRDDCTVFAQRLRDQGTEVHLHLGHGLVHGCLRALGRARAADGAFDALIGFLDSILSRV